MLKLIIKIECEILNILACSYLLGKNSIKINYKFYRI